MRFFKSSKPEEAKEEAQEIPLRPATPDPRAVNTMPDSRAVTPTPRPETAPPPPKPMGSLDGLPQETVPPMGSAPVAPKPAPPVEVRPIPPAAPRSVPDTDALRTLVEQAVRDSEGSKLEAVRLGGGSSAPSLMVSGTLNFPSLYEKVGLPTPPFAAEQMLEMLAKLPTGMQLEMKRDTVNVALEMMGKQINTTEDSIVGDTNRKMTTLATFSQEYDKKTKERVAQGEAEIADLLAQVEAKRQAVAAANQRYATIQKICVVETERLSEIMAFFKATPPPLVAQVFGNEKAGEVKKPATASKPIAIPVSPPAAVEAVIPRDLPPLTPPSPSPTSDSSPIKSISSADEDPTSSPVPAMSAA